MPYGLHLIMTGLSAATHRGDPIALLDQEAALTGLREKIHQPDFIPGLVRKLLLDNPHRLRLSLRPDTHYIRNAQDRKSTRLNSSHVAISYAVFCLKKKK